MLNANHNVYTQAQAQAHTHTHTLAFTPNQPVHSRVRIASERGSDRLRRINFFTFFFPSTSSFFYLNSMGKGMVFGGVSSNVCRRGKDDANAVYICLIFGIWCWLVSAYVIFRWNCASRIEMNGETFKWREIFFYNFFFYFSSLFLYSTCCCFLVAFDMATAICYSIIYESFWKRIFPFLWNS